MARAACNERFFYPCVWGNQNCRESMVSLHHMKKLEKGWPKLDILHQSVLIVS